MWNDASSSFLVMMSSDDGSSFFDSSSDVSSQISDEYPGSRGRPRHIVKKTTIKVENCSGTVAVGTRRAIIKSPPLNHPTGDENLHLPSTSAIQPPDNSPTKEVSPENGRGTSRETKTEDGENCPGFYYQITCKQRDGKKAQKWNAKPRKVILYEEGDATFKWSITEFLKNPVKFICDMDDNACSLQEEKEDFILDEILPHLEESWGKCSSSNEKIYENLAKISCSRKSAKVVRQALQLLFHLICKDNFDSCYENLLVVEAVIRSSILSPEGLFKTDRHSERELKLYVYSRILSSLVIQQVQKGDLRIEPALEQDLKKLLKELKQFGDQLNNKKKDNFRYSIEFIQEAIPCLLKPKDKLKVLLDECQEFCSNWEITSGDLKVLQGSKKNGKWIDLHCILIYLHGKVHCERPVSQMETERRAMKLFRLLVETFLKNGGGVDWRFCVLAASILSDIAMNNATKEMRMEAGGCLVNLLKDTKVQRRPECRAFLQRRSSEVLFCPDKEIRTFLVHFLSKNQNLQHDLPEDLHIKHLSSIYRTPALEINQTIICRSPDCFVKRGMFQRKKAAVKVLFVKKEQLLDDSPFTNARERLIRETDCLRMLNESRHPNITVLLGYDTKSLPYHIITAFEKWGDLLQFVRRSRENSPRLQPVQLLRMLVDIADALLYLQKLGLVHRAVMAANVLVGDNYVCKLSGMQSLQQLTSQTEDSYSLYSYCSEGDGLPEFTSTTAEELPMRWQAPECLLEHRYSTASDVWAFGVLMYEVLTYGCLPYGHVESDDQVSLRVMNHKGVLRFEQCFEEKEYEMVMQCCERQRHRRPKLTDVRARLIEMHENADEELPRPDPPSLDDHVTYESSSIGNADDTYSSVSELDCDRLWHLSEETEKDLDGSMSKRNDFPKRQMFQGMPVICENIAKGDVQHLKRLLALENPNLVPIWKMHNLDSHSPRVEIISKEAPLGNLKEYVLDKKCRIGDIVTFLSQVASALHYLHMNHIVHGDLRAEHVNVSAPGKVQIGRLGRSKPLYMSANEDTSTSCMVEAAMPPDATRWSAPEVILDGHYTHASDVWAFGILAWELYTSIITGQGGRDSSVPFCNLENHKILPHIRNHGPLSKPDHCPDWVFILIHQCWAYQSVQRPPALAISDCLTSREPMKSCIMTRWLANHDRSEWPDLNISQTEDASHVTDNMNGRSKDVVAMCKNEFFTKHVYNYVDVPSATVKNDYDSDDYCRQKAGNSKANESLVISSDYQALFKGPNPLERDHTYMAMNQQPEEQDDSYSGYLCPVGTEDEQRSDKQHHSSHRGTTKGFGSKRSHTGIYQAEPVSRTPHETTYKVAKIKKRFVEYNNLPFSSDQDEASWYEVAESVPNHDAPQVAYENEGHIRHQGLTFQDEDSALIVKRETCLDECKNMEDDGSFYGIPLECLYQNTESGAGMYPIASDQLVPQRDHLDANMQERTVDVVIQDSRSQLGTETGQSHIEAHYQEHETLPQPDQHDISGQNSAKVSERYPVTPSWLNDRKLEVTFDV